MFREFQIKLCWVVTPQLPASVVANYQ